MLKAVVFHALGFEINFENSSLVPTQRIEHLGLIWDSTEMSVGLPQGKIDKIVEIVSIFLEDG